MGVKDTGDYLTARGANPRTGLISPSIVTAQTPRTPMTPGEALRLYSHSETQHSPITPKSRPLSKQGNGQSPVNQWKQLEKGWFMETVMEVTPLKNTTAICSATRTSHVSPEDRFVIPMPSAKEPQPYQDSRHTAKQAAALEHYREKASTRSSPSGINGRMFSIGAGPRKFAEASQKLRVLASEVHGSNIPCTLHVGRPSEAPISKSIVEGFSPRQSLRVSSSGSVDSVMDAMKDMPGGFVPGSPGSVIRKPVGSRPRKNERRGSDATVATATSANEKEVFVDDNTHRLNDQTLTSANTDRFQDLRQLPRVRIVHPDHAALQHPPARDESDLDMPAIKRVFTLPDSGDEAPLPYPRYSTMPRESSPISITAEPSHLETQVIKALAYSIRLCQQIPQLPYHLTSQEQQRMIFRAVNTLTNEKAPAMNRFNAAKTLLMAAGKALALLGVVIATVRIGVAVWQVFEIVFEIVFWPVKLLLAVLRWFVGASK